MEQAGLNKTTCLRRAKKSQTIQFSPLDLLRLFPFSPKAQFVQSPAQGFDPVLTGKKVRQTQIYSYKSLPGNVEQDSSTRRALVHFSRLLPGIAGVHIRCGGFVRVISGALKACIEDQVVIDRILAHLRDQERNTPTLTYMAHAPKAPPETPPLFAGSESATTTRN